MTSDKSLVERLRAEIKAQYADYDSVIDLAVVEVR